MWHKLNNFDDEWYFISFLTPCASISLLKYGKETSKSLQLPHTLLVIQINYQSKPLVWHLQRRFDRSGWQRVLDTVWSYWYTLKQEIGREREERNIFCVVEVATLHFFFFILLFLYPGIPFLCGHLISLISVCEALCCATTIWICLSLVNNFLSLRQKISG